MPETLYEITPAERARLDNNFTYHAPLGDQQVRYVAIRGAAKVLAETLQGACPASRELSVAMTNLEQAVFWANAAIARNEPQPTP